MLTKLQTSLLLSALTLAIVGGVSLYRTNYPQQQKQIGTDQPIDGFLVRWYAAGNANFCAKEEILTTALQHVVSTILCEDMIADISKEGDWVYATTNTKFVFRKNMQTGDTEVLQDAPHKHRVFQ